MKKKDIMIFDHPNIDSYPTPSSLKDKHLGETLLIIGSGPSSKNLLKFRDRLRDKFDVIISLNFSMMDFQEYADYHMILEHKPTVLAKWVRENRVNEKIKHIVNESAIRFLPNDIPIIKANRAIVRAGMSVREYTSEGLYDRFAELKSNATSVMIQALHLAGIMGVSNIYISGGEMCFLDSKHYYVEEMAMNHKPTNRLLAKNTDKQKILFNGKEYYTIPVYFDSAVAANRMIAGEFKNLGVAVNDFSGGLITEATQLSINEFFEKK